MRFAVDGSAAKPSSAISARLFAISDDACARWLAALS